VNSDQEEARVRFFISRYRAYHGRALRFLLSKPHMTLGEEADARSLAKQAAASLALGELLEGILLRRAHGYQPPIEEEHAP
jgi:hypothetical protein